MSTYEQLNQRAVIVWANFYRPYFPIRTLGVFLGSHGFGPLCRTSQYRSRSGKIFRVKLAVDRNHQPVGSGRLEQQQHVLMPHSMEFGWEFSLGQHGAYRRTPIPALFTSVADVTFKDCFDVAWEGTGLDAVIFISANNSGTVKNWLQHAGSIDWTISTGQGDTQGVRSGGEGLSRSLLQSDQRFCQQ